MSTFDESPRPLRTWWRESRLAVILALAAALLVGAIFWLFDKFELFALLSREMSQVRREVSTAPVTLTICLIVLAMLALLLGAILKLSSSGRFLPHPLAGWCGSLLGLIERHASDGPLRRLVRAFLFAYAEQETNQISGRSNAGDRGQSRVVPRNRIYTSFISYSELVRVVLNQVQRDSKDSIVCFATISMPLPQWFNNKPHVLGDFPYTEVDPDWNEYTRLMHDWAHRNRAKIFRLLNVYAGDRRVGPFMDEGKMKSWSRASILLPTDADGIVQTAKWIAPFTRSRLNSLVNELVNESESAALRAYIQNTYAGVPLAYLIVPEGGPTPDIPGHRWRPVWQAFTQLFGQSTNSDRRAFVYRINEEEMAELFRPDHGVPNDAFVVGRQGPDDLKPEWLFYLAGTTDEGCQMVRLEYGTERLENDRIRKILEFADQAVGDIEAANKKGGHKDHIVELGRWVVGK